MREKQLKALVNEIAIFLKIFQTKALARPAGAFCLGDDRFYTGEQAQVPRQ
jgi:hypothetical protein